MKPFNTSLKFVAALLLIVPVFSAHAAKPIAPMDCAKKSLQGDIDKLDKSIANTILFTGNCIEDIVITGFADLTLVGSGVASITATAFDPADQGASTRTVSVNNSKVSLQNLTVNGGLVGVACDHSRCELRDMVVQGGHGGVTAQDATDMDVLGSTSIIDSLGTGIAAYGASNINMTPNWPAGFDPAEAGPVVSGHEFVGAWVQDGSFFRSDNTSFTNNVYGIWAQRNATLKVYSQPAAALPGVSFNAGEGIVLRSSSSAHVGLPITDNGDAGIYVGPLSMVQNAGATFSNNTGPDISCAHSTSVDLGFGVCP